MQTENWRAIAGRVQLEDGDRALLDKVQARLALSDAEFLGLLIVIGKLSPAATKLSAVRLPKR